MDVLGVDSCGKHGWVGVALVDGAFSRTLVGTDLDGLLQEAGKPRVVGVDMPLGLLERGWRAADRRAKEKLGRRHSSIFLTAPAPVWDLPTYQQASAACRELTGGGLSRQAWALRPKLLAAHRCWEADPDRLHEVHPELSFQALNCGVPLGFGKKTWRGHHLRRALLAGAGIELPPALGPGDDVPPDDVLDAAVVAWSALRIALGAAGRLPAEAERDAEGRRIEIRY